MLNAIVIVAALLVLFRVALGAARASRRRGQRLVPGIGIVPSAPSLPTSGCDVGVGGIDGGPSC